MAQVLDRIPVIGSIWGNFEAHQKQLATPTDAKATSGSVSMGVTRAFYDHNRIVLYYTLTIPDQYLVQPQGASQPPNGQVFPQLQFDNNFLIIGGKPLSYNSMLGDGEKRVGPNEYTAGTLTTRQYDIQGLQFGVFANGRYLEPTGGGIPQTHADGGDVTNDVRVTYMAPDVPLTRFEVRPSYTPPHPTAPRLSPVSIPVTEHMPIQLNQGSYGVSKITKIELQKTQTVVSVDLAPQSIEHLPFWFEDGHGHTWKDTFQRTSDGGEIFPAINPDTPLWVDTQKATGDTGASKPLTDLNTTVNLH